MPDFQTKPLHTADVPTQHHTYTTQPFLLGAAQQHRWRRVAALCRSLFAYGTMGYHLTQPCSLTAAKAQHSLQLISSPPRLLGARSDKAATLPWPRLSHVLFSSRYLTGRLRLGGCACESCELLLQSRIGSRDVHKKTPANALDLWCTHQCTIIRF